MIRDPRFVEVVWRDPRFVEVVWRDAHSPAGDYDLAVHHKPTVMYTRGWLRQDDDEGVSVCNERYEEQAKWCYRGGTFVPRACVTAVRNVR